MSASRAKRCPTSSRKASPQGTLNEQSKEFFALIADNLKHNAIDESATVGNGTLRKQSEAERAANESPQLGIDNPPERDLIRERKRAPALDEATEHDNKAHRAEDERLVHERREEQSRMREPIEHDNEH